MAAAFFVAAWLVPSIAVAHTGHHGGGKAVTAALSLDRTALSTDRMSTQIAAVQSVVHATMAVSLAVKSGFCSPSHCGSACAAGAAGCCVPAVAGASGGAVPMPPTVGKPAAFPKDRARLDVVADALRRPPKSSV